MITNWRKSSYSGTTANSDCVEVGTGPAQTAWRKSSYSSSTANSECVEVGVSPAQPVVGVRDTKNRTAGHLEVSRTTWTRFVRHVTR